MVLPRSAYVPTTTERTPRGRPPSMTRPTASVLLAVLLALAAPGVTTAAPSARTAPLLDPEAAHGAWAGYSLGHRSTPRTALPSAPAGAVAGMDVSGHQGHVDWAKARAAGARFTYVKATEGTGYRSPTYAQQYNGSAEAGLIRGAYHYALPNVSSGAAQAHFFVDHGGGWTPDGRTLPGALDIEYNPYGPMCYGLGPEAMSRWITEFSNTYHARTGRFPVIYTTRNWWNRCTGGNETFAARSPLWVARYGPEVGALPAGWAYETFWQFNDHGVFPGDQNTFNGSMAQLRRLTS